MRAKASHKASEVSLLVTGKETVKLSLSQLVCVVAITILFSVPAADANPGVSAWKLSQFAASWGRCNVYATSNAIKIDVPDRMFYLISKAPLWKFEIVNDNKKKSYACDNITSCFAIHRLGTGLGHIKDYKEEKITYRNHPGTLFTSPEKRRSDDLFKFNQYERVTKKSYTSDTNYTVIECKNVPAQAMLLLEQFYDMPRGSLDMPISLFTLRDGEKRYRLQTSDVRQITVDPAIFTAKKYPKAVRPEDLLLAPTAEATEEMLNDAGFY